MSYYKQIDGVSHDRALIEAAEAAVAGRGDGRISKADAQRLLSFVIDGGKITATEQATLVYLRANFTWTDKANAWFKDAIARWEAGDRSVAPVKPAKSSPRESVVLARIGRGRSAAFFPADAAAQAPDGAVIILSRVPGSTPASTVWERTGPHKVADLEKSVETALCNGASQMVQSNIWRFSRILGTHQGMISWTSGFTNVSADTLIAVLKELGLQVVEADTLL
jgi:hypothetical protein